MQGCSCDQCCPHICWRHDNGKQSTSAREYWSDVSCNIPYYLTQGTRHWKLKFAWNIKKKKKKQPMSYTTTVHFANNQTKKISSLVNANNPPYWIQLERLTTAKILSLTANFTARSVLQHLTSVYKLTFTVSILKQNSPYLHSLPTDQVSGRTSVPCLCSGPCRFSADLVGPSPKPLTGWSLWCPCLLWLSPVRPRLQRSIRTSFFKWKHRSQIL